MRSLFFCVFLISIALSSKAQTHKTIWQDTVCGNFSFVEKWHYDINVFRSQPWGELVCDFICDERLDNMKDSTGKIIPDSMGIYYTLLDTSHIYNSIACEGWTYGFAGTDDIVVIRNGNGYNCYTLCNGGMYSSLNLNIADTGSKIWIKFTSPARGGSGNFDCNGGYIYLDKSELKNNRLKARFDLTFYNHFNPNQQMYWKGYIFAKITN